MAPDPLTAKQGGAGISLLFRYPNLIAYNDPAYNVNAPVPVSVTVDQRVSICNEKD